MNLEQIKNGIKEIKNIVFNFLGDKLMHFMVGCFIGFMLCNHLVLAILAVVTVATAKELYDAAHPDTHSAEVMDGVYTVFGGVMGVLIGQILGGLL